MADDNDQEIREAAEDCRLAIANALAPRLEQVLAEFMSTVLRAMGPKADGRRRPRRVAKKIAKRGGCRTFELGALIAMEIAP